MKIHVYYRFNDAFKPVSDLTLPPLRAYCAKHGYTLFVQHYEAITDRLGPVLASERAFDIMVHIDADVLITAPEKRLEPIFEADWDKSLWVGRDINGVNDGIMAIRNDSNGMSVAYEMLVRTDMQTITSPQGALQQILDEGHSLGRAVKVLDQKVWNSYKTAEYTEYKGDEKEEAEWQPGDFALHLPGITNEKRVKIFTEYACA